jgi:hypothetical protein
VPPGGLLIEQVGVSVIPIVDFLGEALTDLRTGPGNRRPDALRDLSEVLAGAVAHCPADRDLLWAAG